jgi:hypothetical protein
VLPAPPHADPGAPLLVYSHGNATDLGTAAWIGAQLRDSLNWQVLVYEYQGYGVHSGTPPCQAALYRNAEAVATVAARVVCAPSTAVYNHAAPPGGSDAERAPAVRPFASVGRSLGCAMACHAAEAYGAATGYTHTCSLLALITPFTSVVSTKLPQNRWLRGMIASAASWFDLFKVQEAVQRLGRQTHTLVFLALNDKITPPFLAKDVYTAVPHGNKKLVCLRGGHNDTVGGDNFACVCSELSGGIKRLTG